MKEESHNPATDPELEARIVALVLGEASDFERAELNRLIQQRPELAALQEQIRRVHGLMQDVGTGELVGDDDDWKLSAEKRSAVLAVMSGEVEDQPAKQVVSKSAAKRRTEKIGFVWNLTKIAAVFCLVGCFGSVVFFHHRMMASQSRQLALNMAGDVTTASKDASEYLWGVASGPSSQSYFADDARTAFADGGRSRETEPATDASFDYKNHSRSALWDIRSTLEVPASTDGANGRTPQQIANSTAVVVGDDAPWSDERDVDADRVIDSRPNAPKLESVELSLSLPTFAVSPDARTIVHALDDGATLRGVRRFAAGRSQFGESSEPTVALPMLQKSTGPETATESWNAANGPVTELELEWDGQAVQQSQSQSSGVVADDELRNSRRGNRERLSGLQDSLEHVEEYNSVEGFVADGENFDGDGLGELDGVEGGGRYGGGGELGGGAGGFGGYSGRTTTAPANELKKTISAQQPPDSGAQVRVLSTPTRFGLPAAEAKQDHGWGDAQSDQSIAATATVGRDDAFGIKERVKKALGDISELSVLNKYTHTNGDSVPDGFVNNATQHWHRPQSGLGTKHDDSVRYRNQPTIERPSRGNVPPRLADNSGPLEQTPRKKLAAPAGLDETTAQDEAFSTFSLHVSDVSFKLAWAALAQGKWPEAAKIRIEEFVNAFDYGDPLPSQSEKVACCLEQSIHPFLQQRNLMRVSMRTAAAGRSSSTPLRLTFLLDNSGSMERPDRQQTVRRAFALLAQQLTSIDQVTLISFARQPRLLADKVSGTQSPQLVQVIDDLPSEGGTNIEAALRLAFEKALEQQVADAQNRIILLTDGAVNLGDADPESLSRMITTMRDAGIAFDAAGISAEGLNDEILEALTRKGDGRYYLLDSVEAADDGFARQIAGALRPSAKNVKVQIEFNPKRVGRYKLLGFEKHRLNQEDFRNDKVDAAEMAAAEAGVAVYQFEAKPDGEGDVGSVSVRFRDLSTGQMIEKCWPIPYEANAPRPDQVTPSLRIATSAALLAAKIRGEPLGETVDLKALSDLLAGLPDQDRNSRRVQQLQMMIQQARQISGK